MLKIYVAFCLFILLFTPTSWSQKISAIAIAPIFEGNLLTAKGFNGINEILRQRNIYTFGNEFQSNGISLTFTRKNPFKAWEISLSRVSSNRYDSTASTNRAFLPLLTGSNFRVLYNRGVFQTGRFYGTVGLGVSMIKLNFKLIDARQNSVGFDSLLSAPTTFKTIDIRQRSANANLEVHGSVGFRTKFFKKAFDDFDIGARFGYVQAILNDRTWVLNGTSNSLIANGLPAIDMSNFYFQLSFAFKYKFKSSESNANIKRG